MPIESVKERFNSLVRSTPVRRAANALFPNDFEAYVFAFELVNSAGDTVDYFVFPINPTSYEEGRPFLTTISKTAGGYTTMTNNTFSARTIRLSGNFGRKFKLLLGGELFDFGEVGFGELKENLKSANKQSVNAVFDSKVKTGYGTLKVLEKMLNKTDQLDESEKPHTLYFYNLSLGNNYAVKPTNFDFSQNMESNMIWNYRIELTALAPLENIVIRDQRALTSSLSFTQGVQQGINAVGRQLRTTIGI